MLTREEMRFLNEILGLNLNFSNLKSNDWAIIEDAVASKLETSGFDKNYKLTKIGIMCESILDKLP